MKWKHDGFPLQISLTSYQGKYKKKVKEIWYHRILLFFYFNLLFNIYFFLLQILQKYGQTYRGITYQTSIGYEEHGLRPGYFTRLYNSQWRRAPGNNGLRIFLSHL
jgi:hypothetical protein